jgi:hypothetical protein
MALTNAELQFNHRRTKKGTISNKRQSCKKNANNKGLEFSLSTEYLTMLWDSQRGCCAFCGGELGFIGSGWSAASVDRIDPTKGYVEGNVQWAHWRCNDAKANMDNEDFLRMCAAITAKHFARL